MVFTLAPVDSKYTAGLIGAEPVCAQSGIFDCLRHWQNITEAVQEGCPPDTDAHCQMTCDLDTGDIGYVSCICAQ